MRWTRTELLKGSGHIDFEEDVEISDDVFAGMVLIHGVKDVQIWGSGYLDDENDRFYCQLNVTGTMIVPDSITDEEIEVSFETDSDEVFVFGDTDEDGARIVTDEEVPLEVTDAAEDDLPEGDGWKVYTEAEYEKSRSEQIDPRLAKLMEFKDE